MDDITDYEYDNVTTPKDELKSNWSWDYLEGLDTSQYDFPNTLWHIKPLDEILWKASFMVLIGISGIFLNSIILIIITRNRWLWSASNYLIGNMALIDLVTLIFCPWFMLIRNFYQNYVLGILGCRFEGFLQASLLLAGVGAVMLVSYDRLAIAALTQEARITKQAAPKLIVCSWILAAALSMPWILEREYVERPWLNHVEKYCAEKIKFLGVYWHMITTLLVWVPLGLMIVTYGTIMWRLEYSARKLMSRGGGQSVGKARGKAMKITACVLLTAAVCRLPYTILVYWRNNLPLEVNSVDGGYEIMWFTANYLMYANCALNPLIYGFTNERFKRAMDKTPMIAFWRFGSWCCTCSLFRKREVQLTDRNLEKIFVIDNTPRPNRKFSRAMRNILHINKNTLELSVPKADEFTMKCMTSIKQNILSGSSNKAYDAKREPREA